MNATVLKPDHALETEFLVEVEPSIDDIGFSALQKAVETDGMRRHAISNLEQGSTAFTDIGLRIVVTMMTKLLGLGLSQVEDSAISSHEMMPFFQYVAMVPSHYPFARQKP